MKKQSLLACICVAALVFPVGQATGADHLNLEGGLPLQIEDAYPISYRGREIQSVFRYDYTREEEDRFVVAPQFEFGPLKNTEVTIRAPFYIGETDRTGSGDVEIEALYNFNTETIYLPALALEAGGIIPSGKASQGFDTSLAFLATKSVSRMGLDRVHFNAVWMRNAGAHPDEREHRYRLVAGYSRRLAPDWVILADFIREQERKKNEDSNIFEIGVRWQLTPLTVISFGAGAGVGRESPIARAVLGFQKSI